MQVGLLLRSAQQRHPDPDDDEHAEQRRQQPSGPSQPELAQMHPRSALALLDQQRRDEEAGDDEEHLDAEKATVHPSEPGVVEDDGNHRDRPQPVEAGLVPHGLRRATGG